MGRSAEMVVIWFLFTARVIGNEGANRSCIRVAVETWEPYLLVRGTSPPRVSGVMLEVIDTVRKKLGRCVQFKAPELRGMGQQLPNGTWIGLLGVIFKKEADMSGVMVSVTDDRARYFDFSVPITMDEKVLAHKWPRLESDMNGMFKPFTSELWLYLGLVFLVVCGATFLIQWRQPIEPTFSTGTDEASEEKMIQWKDDKGKGMEEREHSSKSLWYSCFWTFSSFIGQPCPWYPSGQSIRIITGIWLLLAMVVSNVYRSNLKAMLILPKVRLPFDNMEELVSSGIKTYLPAQSFVYNAMINAPRDSAMYRLQKQALVHFDARKATEGVLSGLHAVFTGRIIVWYLIHQGFERTRQCPLYIASETFFGAVTFSYAFAKGSALMHEVNPIIQRLKEAGILDHITNNAISNVRFCSKFQTEAASRPLELGDFYGVLLIYLGGLIFSLFAFVAERYNHRHTRRR
ncbi:probable glutamate receptor [Macrobrachium rosenbergii]|uniref:probable glutamate receptor n=1 Tax=Macrobrachium rosenbergii TaxID=79674 RepID=UPI0034D6B4C5